MHPNNPNLIPMPEIEEENEFLKEVATYVGNKDDYFNYDGYTLVENECIFFSLLVALANHNEYIPLLKDYNLDIFKEFFDSKPKNYTQKCENIYKNTLLPLIKDMNIKTPGEIVLKFISLHFDELKALYMYIPNVKGTLNDFKSSLLSVCQRLTSNWKEESISLTPKDYLNSLTYEKRNYLKLYAKLYTYFTIKEILSLDDVLDFHFLRILANGIVRSALGGNFTAMNIVIKTLGMSTDYNKLQNGSELDETYFLDLIKSGKFTIEDFKSIEQVYDKNINFDAQPMLHFIKKFINLPGAKPEKKQDVIIVESKQEEIDYDEFYDNISLELIGFLNYTGKIYTFLLKKYSEKKLNRLAIKDKKELASLAVLIATFKYNGSYLSKFYINNQIDINRVLECSGIKTDEINEILNSGVEDYSNHKNDDENTFNFKAVYDAYNDLINRKYDYKIDDFVKTVISNDDLALIRIYSLNTGVSVYATHLKETIDKYNVNLRKKELDEYREKFSRDNNVDVFHLLQLACPYYDSLYEKPDLSDEEKATFALLYALFDKYNFDITDYLKQYGINSKSLDNHLNFLAPEVNPKIDFELVRDVFSKYMETDKKDLSVTKIIENALKSNSISVKEFLDDNGLSSSLITEEKVYKYIDDAEKIERNKELRELICHNDLEGEKFRLLSFSTKVYNYLSSLKDAKNLEDKRFRAEASVFISYLLNDKYLKAKILKKYGFTLDAVLDYLEIKDHQEFIKNVSEAKEDSYLLLNDYYKDYINTLFRDDLNEDNDVETSIAVGIIIYNTLFDDIFSRVSTISFDDFEYEVLNGKEKQGLLTKEQIIDRLKNSDVDEEFSDDVYSVLTFGNDLSRHTTLIVDELSELLASGNLDNTLEELNKDINNIYTIKPAVVKEKTVADKVFRRKNEILEPEKRELNLEAIKTVQSKITSNIEQLNKELISFKYIKRYYELYLAKLDRYIKVTEEKIEEVKRKLEDATKVDAESNESISYSNLLKLLDIKLNAFLTARSTAKAEFVKTHEAISNHFITIQGLITAHDVLVPLLGSEVLLAVGKTTENGSLDLTNNLVSLLHNLLTKNIEGTKQNIQKLSEAGITEETVDKLKKDLELYASRLTNLREDNKETKRDNESYELVRRNK